jgi:hypothetical protein
MTIYDLYENVKYGSFGENRYTCFKPTISNRDELLSCEVYGRKCTSIQEFNSLVGPYMND